MCTKVVGAINYYKINIVHEHYHWVIYKMLFREELKPNLNSQSNSIGVCVYLCTSPTLKAVENKMKGWTFRSSFLSSFLSLLKRVLINMMIMLPLL